VKLFCEACQRLGEPGPWSVIDGVLRVACGSCGVPAELVPRRRAAAPAVALEGAVAAPVVEDHDIDRVLAEFIGDAAPAPRNEVRALAGASLAEQETAAALAVATAEETVDDEPWLAIGWARVQQSWSDPAAHAKLLAEAAARGDFAPLGKRYREHLAKHPKDAAAVAARDELLKKATAQMFTQLPRDEGIDPVRARSLRNGLLLLFFLGVLVFGGWILVKMGGGT
jgi:hypothetical protein